MADRTVVARGASWRACTVTQGQPRLERGIDSSGGPGGRMVIRKNGRRPVVRSPLALARHHGVDLNTMVWGLCPILRIVADGAVPNHPSAARRCDGSRRARGRRPVGRLVGMVRGSGLHGGHRAPDPHAGRREAADGADDEERQDGQDEHRQPDERRARRQDASRPTSVRCGGREHRRRRAESRRDGTRGRWCDRRVDAGPRRTPQGSRRAVSRSGVGAAAGGGETLRCVRRRAHDEGESTRAPRDALEGASLRRNDIMYIIGATLSGVRAALQTSP